MPNAISGVFQQDVDGRCGIEAPPTSSSLPSDAVAVIYRPARSAMTSGLRNTRTINPKIRYIHPSDVLRDLTLSVREKHDILQRWALEAYRRETDAPERGQSQLDNVIDALIDLDSGEPLAVLAKRADMQRFGSRTEGKVAA